MKKIIVLIFLLITSVANASTFPEFSEGASGSGGGGTQISSNCDQSQFYAIGVLCQSSVNGKLYKGTGTSILEVAAGASTGDATGPSGSTDSELPLFSGTGGKTLKRSNTLSGLAFLTSGVVSMKAIGTDVQAQHASLTSIAGLTESAGGFPYFTADNAWAVKAAGTAYQLLMMKSDASQPDWTSTLGATGTRLTKAWLTDLEITNYPTVNGIAVFDQDVSADANPSFGTINVVSANSLNLGTAGSNVGGIRFKNATSGYVELLPPTGALGTGQIILPASGTLATTTGSPAGFVITSQAAGDILYATSGSAWARLGKGTDDYVLTMSSSTHLPVWAAATGGAGYTNLTSFVDQTAWRVFYSDGSGDVKELALGSNGTYLKSNGASSAPTFDTPAGSGDVLAGTMGTTGQYCTKNAATKTIDCNTTLTGGGDVTAASTTQTWGADSTLAWTFSVTGTDPTLTFTSQKIASNSPISITSGTGLSLNPSSVTNPFTTIDSDTHLYYSQRDVSSSDGGFLERGFSNSDSTAFTIQGYLGSTNPTDSIPAVKVQGMKLNGTTAAALGNTETVFAVQNNSTDVLTVLGNSTVTATTFVGALTGNASTATALASNPAACTTGQYVTDIAADGTLTCGTPAGGGDMVLASAQSVTGTKTFDTTKLSVKGSSTGATAIASANASASNYTQTLKAETGDICTTGSVCSGYQASGSYLTSSSPAITTPAITTGINDVNTKRIIGFTATGTAVDYLNVTNAATAGHTVLLGVAGDDTDITLTISGKGTGKANIDGVAAGNLTSASTLDATKLSGNLPAISGASLTSLPTQIDNTAYDATSWDNVTTLAPTKNAVRDYLESKISSGADGSYYLQITNNSAISPTASVDQLYPEANIWKANQNGTEYSVVLGPTGEQLKFSGTLTNGKLCTYATGGAMTCNTDIGSGSIGGSTGSTDKALLAANGTGGATVQGTPTTINTTTGVITTPQQTVPDLIELRPGSGATNPTYYRGFKGPAQPVTGYTAYQLPDANPTAGQVMTFGAVSSNVSAVTWMTPQVDLSLLKGTYTNGYLCKYTASGTLLDCNVDPAGLGGGTGDITDVGDCISGSCLTGGASSGTYIRLYDGTSAYTAITAGVRTLTFAPSNSNAENMVVTFGNNDNTVALSSGTGGVVNISGNAATATALAANPSACSAGQYVSDIAADGTLTCGTPSGSGTILGTIAASANYITVSHGTANTVKDSLVSINSTTGVITTPQQTTPDAIELREGSGSGTNKVTVTVPTTMAADYVLTLPARTGTVALSNIAGTSLTEGAVYYQGASALALAEGDSATHTPGICIADSTTSCKYSGVYVYASTQSWTKGDVIYLSSTSAGSLVKVKPTAGGTFVQRIGVALDVGTILIMPSLDVGGN